jgi:hypothetical protein
MAAVLAVGGTVVNVQDKYLLKSPDGIAFSDFKSKDYIFHPYQKARPFPLHGSQVAVGSLALRPEGGAHVRPAAAPVFGLKK